MKGADSVMANIVRHADWLEEEVCVVNYMMLILP